MLSKRGSLKHNAVTKRVSEANSKLTTAMRL